LNKEDKKKYLDRYDKRLKQFGYDPKSLGWGTGGIERQFIRFKHLLEIENFSSHQAASLLDIGCGFGDCYKFIKQNNLQIEYTGIDINNSLIDIASQNHPEGIFVCGDILEKGFFDLISNKSQKKYDIVISSGIFNYKLANEDQYDYICKMLESMFAISRVGVAADFLTDHVDFAHEGAFHTSIQNLYSITRKNITKKSVFRNDYLDYEFILYLLK